MRRPGHTRARAAGWLALTFTLGAHAASRPDCPTAAEGRALVDAWFARTDVLVPQAWERQRPRNASPSASDYENALRRLFADLSLTEFFAPPADVAQALLCQKDDPDVARLMADAQAFQDARRDLMRNAAADPARLARSLDAPTVNPRAVGLAERAGLVDVVTLALQGTNFVNADDSAVTLNLNAAGLLKKPGDANAVEAYRRRGFLNRIGGSVTFGAKVPQKDAVGFSGFPEANELFDVFVWDVKLRLVGDRDPRAAAWDPARFQVGGGDRVLLLIPGDAPELEQAKQRVAQQAGERNFDARRRRSWVVSAKAAGQVLTQEAGRNKLSLSLLADKGLGGGDLTLNVTYDDVQDVTVGAASPLSLKAWAFASGFSTSILPGVVVPGQAAELTVSAKVTVPHDSPPGFDRKTTWRADVALRMPVSDTLRLPVSVTYTNDPNALAKQNFVRGQIGIQYDFGALKNLLKAGGK